MTTNQSGPGPLIAGAGGALLIVSLFLPWADVSPAVSLPGLPAGDASANGWELWTMADVFLLIVGVVAILAAITGGRFGVFRPDLSLIGATDLLGVVSSVLIGWLILFDFLEGASREIGIFLALIGAMTVACGAADWRVLRSGAPLFPRTSQDDRQPAG